MRILTLVCLVCCVGLLSAFSVQDTAGEAGQLAQEENIREAIIRYEISQWSHSSPARAHEPDKQEQSDGKHLDFRVCFVSIDGKDPSKGFLNRFRDTAMVVEKASRRRGRFFSLTGKVTRKESF